MIVSLLVAASENNAIGKDNRLLWDLPNDMKFFKNTTWGMAVIMGRKTYDAIKKPLPGRFNVVITRQAQWEAAGAISASDIQDAVKKAATSNCNEVFVIGGGEIYKQAIEIADKILITRVHASFEADAFFPEIDETKWELTASQDFGVDEKHKYAYSFQTWLRK